MTHPSDSSTGAGRPNAALAALAANPATVSVQGLWGALEADERRRAIAIALQGDRSMRRVLTELLRATPRYRGFRPQHFASWKAEQFADALKNPGLLSVDAVQGSLIALHVTDRSAMLAAFLDSLGVPHENGVIEEVPAGFAPDEATLAGAADALAERFPRREVMLYFLTLLALEPQLWGGLRGWLQRQPAPATA